MHHGMAGSNPTNLSRSISIYLFVHSGLRFNIVMSNRAIINFHAITIECHCYNVVLVAKTMGITGLLPFITSPQYGAIRTVSIREFKGQTAAIDGYVLLHRGAFSCAKQLFEGNDTDVYVSHCMRYIDLLQKHGVRPLLVFDGAAIAAKRETERQRRDVRKTARIQAVELLTLGKTTEAYQAMSRAIDVTHMMALRFIKAARKRGIDSIVAPYEADAQLAYLTRAGLAHFVITEDSDLIVFGCDKILFKLQLTGEGRFYDKSLLERALCTKKLRCTNYSFEKFRIACILSGCDYTKSLSGIGLARAWKFASITESLEDLEIKLPKMAVYLNMSGLEVSEDYIRQVKIANGAFKHQVIYDPVERRRMPLEEFHEDSANCVITAETVGEVEMNEEESLDRALGNIDPMSGAQLDNYRPTDNLAINATSIWNRNRLVQSTLTTAFTPIQNDKLKEKPSVGICTPHKAITIASIQELEAQDIKLTTLLQQYAKTDMKMSSTVKECYYQDLYDGQNSDTNDNTDISKHISVKNPFIKRKNANDESPNQILENNKVEEVITQRNDNFKSSIIANKSLQSSCLKLHNTSQNTERCPFKKQRNIKYDQVIIQKRKAGENEYFSSNIKKSKPEDTNEISTECQETEDSNSAQEADVNLLGKENHFQEEIESDPEISFGTKNSLDLGYLMNSQTVKNDIILNEINTNVKYITHESTEMAFKVNNVDSEFNLNCSPDKDIANKEIETLCKDVDTICVESDELIRIDEMLECILAVKDDANIEITEQHSPIIKRHKKRNCGSISKTTKALDSKNKKQTTLLSFFHKV